MNLFNVKGKCKVSKEWIFGTGYFHYETKKEQFLVKQDPVWDEPIEPEIVFGTLCRSIQAQDRKGNELYENDVVSVYSPENNSFVQDCRIVYNLEKLCWELEGLHVPYRKLNLSELLLKSEFRYNFCDLE